jgi:hypothetical protein
MTVESKNQLFRLAAVLYADNNYEVAPKTIIRKVIESALLSNGNKAINIHSLIDFVHESYNLHLVEEEVKSIVTSDKEEGFLINEKNGDTIVCLHEKRKQVIESKITNKTIDYFINEFEKEKETLVTGSNTKEIIYRFLYELLSTNIESFKKLLDSKKKIEDLINVESHTYTAIEREIINEFLGWDNNDKNKAIFDIASYALEYCMISNNSGATHIHLNNLKNKIFYLDTNVIFRALGINGLNRQNRTNTFLRKFLEANTQLVISKFSETEFKDTITFYLDKLKRTPLNRRINPEIFQEKYFKSLSDVYDFYYKWRAGKANDSLELFEGYIMSLYEKFKTDFKVLTDYKIPFDEKEEKVEKAINELSASICSYKNTDGARHGVNGDNIDALNILLVETKRDGKNSSIFETKQFIVSTDQSLRRWDYYRNTVTPIVILPSQWLSILLRYINRSNDDFKSFVSFLNLPSGESQIDSEKIHIILAGISEMTENFEQQRFIVQSLVQKKFDGILEKGVKDDEILERTKAFAKTELEKKVEEIGSKHETLKSELDTHKQATSEKIGGLELKTSEQTQKLTAKEKEVERLKSALKIKTVKEEIQKWQRPAKWLIPFGLIIIVFTVLQFCCKDWAYNYSYKIINAIDTLESETQKNTLRALLYTPLIGLWLICTFCFNRLTNSETKETKQKELEKHFDDTNK